MAIIQPLISRLYPELKNALNSIKEARKHLEDEPVDVYRDLLTKINDVLKKENNGEKTNFKNEFSESIFSAWNEVFNDKYNEYISKVDMLNWALVDTTDERKFIRELDTKYDFCGLKGTLYNEGRFEDALSQLKRLIKEIENKQNELEDGFNNRIIGRVIYLILPSVALWVVTIETIYGKISILKLIIILLLEPIAIYSVVVGFFLLFSNLGRLTSRRKRKKN